MSNDGSSRGRNVEKERLDQRRALALAEDHLKSMRKGFPERDGGESITDWYQRTREHSELEGTVYAKFLQQLSARPIAFDSTQRDGPAKPYTQKWGVPDYD